jgi:cell pole-organizing protein PopZ
MEEILASIRRIIADDQEALQIVHGSADEKESSPLRSVLELTEQHVSADGLPIQFDCDEGPSMVAPLDDDGEPANEAIIDFPGIPRAEPAAPRVPAPAAPAARAPSLSAAVTPAEPPLLSDAANASVAGAFGRLDAAMVQSSPKTLEDLAKEMLRPMLKTWLDDNLPLIVERLVQAEIERMNRARR